MKTNQKACDIRAALVDRFAPPESAIVFEVAQGTGSDANRHLDAIAMELWPSRGLAIHGIEIKVNLYDWRREKANPAKAEEVARFCDYFWIAAPEGLIPIDDLPTAWGLLSVSEAGVAGVAKQAARTKAVAIDRPFLAAMLRAATRPIARDTLQSMLAAEKRELEEKFASRVEVEAERIARRNDEDGKHWQALVGAIGEDPKKFYSQSDLIEAVRVVLKSGIASTWRGVRSLYKDADELRIRLGTAMGELSIEPDQEQPPRRARRKRA